MVAIKLEDYDCEVLKNKLIEGFTAARRTKPIDWKFVMPIIDDISKKVAPGTSSRSLWNLFRLVFRLFEKYQCRDLRTIADLLQFACVMWGEGLPNFRVGTDYQLTFRAHWNMGISRGCFFQQMKMAYENTIMGYDPRFDIVRHVLRHGGTELVWQLLKYGVMCLPSRDLEDIWRQNIELLQSISDASNDFQVQNYRSFMETISTLSTEDRRRLIVVFWAVEMMLRVCFLTGNSEGILTCFRLEFESIQAPFVTCEEIASFLSLVLDGPSEDVISIVCTRYASHFPEGVRCLQPRSLLHLSRCRVRQSLREAESMPFGVNSLHITCLQDYILLKEYRSILP